MLHPKNRVVFYSFLVWIQTIILFGIGLFVASRLNSQSEFMKELISTLLLLDIVLSFLAFLVMSLSAIYLVIGKKIILVLPIFILIALYFVLIYPKTKQEIKPHIIKQYHYTLINSELKVGSSGEEVIVLQSALSTKKYLSDNLVTGFYGDLTKKAVSAFQADSGLPTSGVMDEETRKAFNLIFGKDNDSSYYLSLLPINTRINSNSNTIQNNSGFTEWGKSVRVEGTEHGWTMNVGSDPIMGTPQETFDALNVYRSKKGVRGLNWDRNLSSYAQQRAAELVANGGVDDHKGFKEYIGNIENREKLGFYGLGENSSCGFRLNGTHLIEWVFAGDPPHDNNQLDPVWSDVGIGISNTCVAIIFGSDRMN